MKVSWYVGAVVGLSLCCAAARGAERGCNANLERWLGCNNPRVMAYLGALSPRDRGRRLVGVPLTDGSTVLAGALYRGRVPSVPAGVHIYRFTERGHEVAYLWLDPGAKPLPLPTCPSWGAPADAHVLSGDVYTWKAAQPGHGVIEVDCVATGWGVD